MTWIGQNPVLRLDSHEQRQRYVNFYILRHWISRPQAWAFRRWISRLGLNGTELAIEIESVSAGIWKGRRLILASRIQLNYMSQSCFYGLIAALMFFDGIGLDRLPRRFWWSCLTLESNLYFIWGSIISKVLTIFVWLCPFQLAWVTTFHCLHNDYKSNCIAVIFDG